MSVWICLHDLLHFCKREHRKFLLLRFSCLSDLVIIYDHGFFHTRLVFSSPAFVNFFVNCKIKYFPFCTCAPFLHFNWKLFENRELNVQITFQKSDIQNSPIFSLQFFLISNFLISEYYRQIFTFY